MVGDKKAPHEAGAAGGVEAKTLQTSSPESSDDVLSDTVSFGHPSPQTASAKSPGTAALARSVTVSEEGASPSQLGILS